MALVERLAILITGDASGAINEMKKVATEAEKNAAKADGTVSKFSGTATKVGAGMVAAGAGLLAFAVSGISTAEALGGEVRKLQRYTGMTAEEASRLAAIAKHVNVPVDTLAAGLGKLSKTMEAGSPGFDSLGVSARDSDGKLKSLGAFLPELADKFKDLPNGPEKTATALQLFGRNGMEMMPFLNKGAAGMKELGDEAEKMGLVLSQDNVDQILKSKEAHKKLDETLQGLKTQIGLQVMPVITSFTEILGSIPGPIQDILVPLVTFGGVALVGFGAVGMLVGALKNLGPMFNTVKTAVATFSLELGPIGWTMLAVGAAVAVATAAIGIFGDSNKVNAQNVADFTTMLNGEAAALDDSIRTKAAHVLADKNLSQAFTDSKVSSDDLIASIKDGGTALKQYATQVKDNGSNSLEASRDYGYLTDTQKKYVDGVRASWEQGNISLQTMKNLISQAGNMSAEYGKAKTSTDALKSSTEELNPPVKDLADAQSAAASATADHVQAAKDLDAQLHATFDPMEKSVSATRAQARAQQDQEKATRDVAAAQKALTDAQATGDQTKIAEATDNLTSAQRRLEDSNSTLLQATADQEVAFTNLRGELEQHPEKFGDAIKKIDDWAVSGKITTTQAEAMKTQLYLAALEAQNFPDHVNLKFNIETWEAAEQISDLDRRVQVLNQLAHSTEGDFFRTHHKDQNGNWVENASGGFLPAGRMSLVGEHGPELFIPSSSGSVVNALSTSHAMAGGDGGSTMTINITMPPGSDGADVVEAIRKYERMNGTGWRN
jgi:hypothetical protein